MLYVLDTNVLCDLEKQRPNDNLQGWVGQLDAGNMIIPVTAIYEIQKGIELARASHPERAAEREAWLEGLVVDASPLNADGARLLARMVGVPSLRGRFLDQNPASKKVKRGEDLEIAALGIQLGAAIVSFNARDFMFIHNHFPLPGVFHPGRLEWCVPPDRNLLGDRTPS